MAKGEASLLVRIQTAGEEALESLKGSLQKVGEIGVATFAALSAVLTKSILDFQEQEEATNSLTRTMVNNGIYTKELKDEYLGLATQLQKVTTFGDEQIIAAQSAVQQHIGQIKVTRDLTMAILDFATAQKMDLASAAEVVGKSIGTNTNALGRYGIEVAKGATETQKMGQVISGINGLWGGQAQAATQGLGAIKQLKNALSDVGEVVGERIAPVITYIARSITQFASSTEKTTGVIETLVGTFEFMAKVGITAFTALESIGEKLGTRLGGLFGAISLAMKGQFKDALGLYNQIWGQIDEINARKQQDLNNRLQSINDAFTVQKKAEADQEVLLLEQTAQRKIDVLNTKASEESAQNILNKQAAHDLEMNLINANEEQKYAALISYQQKQLDLATTHAEKLALLQSIEGLRTLQKTAGLNAKLKEEDDKKIKDREDTGRTIATLANSNNSALATIGKAAALTQIAIDTPVAVSKALAAFPPPINFAAAGAVGVAMAAQAARVAGIPLAEGGVVMPRPGGTQAIIGEAGQPEAVIPLDKMGGMGGGVTINVNGGLLGDASSARELAIAIDRQLLELRRNNESVSFEDRVI